MPFEDLEVWKRAVDLSADLYRKLAGLTDRGFREQITRSGLSVPSNISEGMEHGSLNEKLRYLGYAKASCGELRTQIHIGMRAGYVDEETGVNWIKETQQLSAMLVGLMRAIEKDK
jgi:four helix bundle protein